MPHLPIRSRQAHGLALALGLLLAAPALAPPPAAAAAEGPARASTPYSQGKMRVGLGGGGFGRSGNVSFYAAGSFGVFVVDNLELGADLGLFFGSGPFTMQLGPTLRYIIPAHEAIHPYFGAFYYHWFIGDGLPDVDTVGGRLGALIRTSHLYFGIGLVYEHIVSACARDCGSFYPEFGVSFLF